MAVGDLITSDYQLEVNETLLLGAGTVYDIISMEGFDLPSIRSGDTAKTLRNGYWAGSDLLDGRTITLELTVSSPDDDTQAAALDALTVAFSPTSGEQTFAFQLPGYVKRFVNARVRRINIPVSWEYQFHLPTVTIELYATDPLIYECANHGIVIGHQTSGGGLTFSAVPSFTFGTMPIGGRLTVSNVGTYATNPKVTFFGPLTNPSITVESTGEFLALKKDLQAGDYVEVDFTYHRVYLNGSQNFLDYSILDLASTWFTLPVGDTELVFEHSGVDDAKAHLNLEYRSAWV